MVRTKATVRRLPVVVRNDFQQRTIKPFKIKEILPKQKTVDIKKNQKIIKTINVRRISICFSCRNRLMFFLKMPIWIIFGSL